MPPDVGAGATEVVWCVDTTGALGDASFGTAVLGTLDAGDRALSTVLAGAAVSCAGEEVGVAEAFVGVLPSITAAINCSECACMCADSDWGRAF